MTKQKQENLIKLAPKAIVNLRSQYRAKRLGLVFGAGISVDLGYPKWGQLVERIANHSEVGAAEIWKKLEKNGADGRPVTRTLASITQMLFSEFRKRQIASQNLGPSLSFYEERKIKTKWLQLIHGELYAGTNKDSRAENLKNHPYINAFTDLIKKSPLTVTYNFDDSLEQLLESSRTNDEREMTRGYEMVDQPNSQFRRPDSVIYHPNGCLPAEFYDGASADVILSDDSFQDQLISAANGKYLHLSNHLFRNTCLLIGLSLEDATLQSLMRQNAVENPGNIHYIVHYKEEGKNRDKEADNAIFNANFESFGLYTLFLTSDEIATLANIIEMDDQKFSMWHAKLNPKFVYYMIGSVGAGKSTAAKKFRNLITHDEWMDARKNELAKPEAAVSTEQIVQLNDWISNQFYKKNFTLQNYKEGIHIVDRSPLDPLTFGLEKDRANKAAALLERITENGIFSVVPGHIIQLQASIDDIRIRNSLKHKYWPDEEYQNLIHAMEEVYGKLPRSVVCTIGRSATDVAKAIARIIFLEEYQPVDIQAQLAEHASATQFEVGIKDDAKN